MKLKKLITMGIAAIMAVSAMSVNVFATENASDQELNFYNSVQILTFNSETQTFDSRIEPATTSNNAKTSNYTFTFDQTISTSNSYLKNLITNSELYLVGDDDTMVIRFDDAPTKTLELQLCKSNGTPHGAYCEIEAREVVVELYGLSEEYNLIGSCKVRLRTTTGSTNVSGSISEY